MWYPFQKSTTLPNPKMNTNQNMWFSRENLPSPKTILSTSASIAASVLLFRSIADDLVPDALHDYFSMHLRRISNCLSTQLTVVIEDFDGLTKNQMFEAANVYLGTKLLPTTRRIKVNKPLKENELAVTIDNGEELIDLFKGVKFSWVLVSSKSNEPISSRNRNNNVLSRSEMKHFELSFHKKHRDMVLKSYLPYILQKAKAIKEEKKAVKLNTIDYNGTDYWSSINLNHPARFDTIAMEPEMKRMLIEDLDRFIARKDYYRRVGRSWKRGYLFYGPPGTGKSSLVAAMANYLKFDIYDLDLREVQCNSDLRRLLIGTGNQSILVMEDIDCTLPNRDSEDEDKVTLSGLLNFIDGLWSSCGDEKIIVLTTNHKDRLDPALLRPGRMDVHLCMSYCTFNSFKTLAYNYLGIQEHPLFEDIKELLENVQATPAEVANELMKSDNADTPLRDLVKFLQSKKGGTGLVQN